MKIMREVRCFPDSLGEAGESLNSWGGSPRGEGLGAFWVLRGVVDGPVQQDTGYVFNILKIANVLSDVVVPCVRERVGSTPHRAADIAAALIESARIAAERFPEPAALHSLELETCPYLRFLVEIRKPAMIHVTQSFEFSASHRLFCSAMSDEENRRVFGKCANVHGHGHNYVIEVTTRGEPHDTTGTVVDLPRAQRVVKEQVIDRFDHKHLNLDCEEFDSINPSVENIARVIWDKLVGRFERAELALVRVWETPKTYAEYAGNE